MDNYSYITDKIHALKERYPLLRERTDDYFFSVLCVKAHFYKNPALILNEDDFAEMIVDGSNDLGIDILLINPNSEGNDLIVGQSKFYKAITFEQVLNAMRKMADFYNDMLAGHYERFNERVKSRFRKLYAEIGDESKIHFVFYTSAPKNRIDIKRLKRKFLEQFTDSSAIEIDIFFAADIEDEIKESLSRKPTVEYGKIQIDEANNYLTYGEDAVIVNVSAFSIKKLYAEHKTNLPALNLRYHIKENKRDSVDNKIKNTIDNAPASFWLKNNGITIICDSFKLDGVEIKLTNFSIVNGGQTTFQIYKNSNIDAAHDFYLPCKIIKNIGETEDEKNTFSLSIAEAANSQKPITQDDLKANAPEQISFAKAMRQIGVFYQTKRGEKIHSKEYSDAYPYCKTKLEHVGKLCMAAIFQMPCVSRNKKKMIYQDRHYRYIFIEKQPQVAAIGKELLYIEYYFNKKFKPKFKRDNEYEEEANARIGFANNARTICVAFTALAARYHQGNITDETLKAIFAAAQADSNADDLHKAVRDIGEMKSLLPKHLSENMNLYDAALDKLFTAVIEEGISAYSYARDNNSTLTANSFLQNDKNYYRLLKGSWKRLKDAIQEIFSDV